MPLRTPLMATYRPPPTLEIETRTDGIVVARSGYALDPGQPLLIDMFDAQGEACGDRPFLAERGANGEWVRLSFAAAAERSARVATGLIRAGIGPGQRVAILCGNSIAHALMTFGAMRAGATVVPISPAYSLAGDSGHLRHVARIAPPDVVFAIAGTRFGSAIAVLASRGARVITGDGAIGTHFETLFAELDRPLLARRRSEIDPDTPAKVFFTSGSTGRPKGVANTHAQLAAAMAMYGCVVERHDPPEPRVLLDWLPWNHVYGGNVVLNEAMRSGGTIHIDEGRPVPGRFEPTLENLRDVSPTIYGSVPAAYAMLADAMERDAGLRDRFFARLRGLRYGGGLLPQETYDRIQTLARAATGRTIPFSSGWGMTETAGTGIACYWDVERTGLLGLPLPGITLKLVPLEDDRFDLRIRGPNVFTGYLGGSREDPGVFDEEGFFVTGDAARWIDPSQPIAGLAFAGRLAEQYKLATGTWVQAGELRLALLAALRGAATEVVVTGPGRPWVGALVWGNPAVVREVGRDGLESIVRARMQAYNAHAGGSSRRVRRAVLAEEMLSFAAGEVTDKRSVNQRRILERRAPLVEALYASRPGSAVIELD